MKIHYFQHVPFEGLGSIREWAESRNHSISVTQFFQNDIPPVTDEFDWLVILGGPMGINDEDRYPWLADEKKYIYETIKQQKKVLGICLGAQLIASALGARVYPNMQKEIGWFPVRLTKEGSESEIFKDMPDQLTAFHWHSDTFDIPSEAKLLATSEVCKHQAFIYKKKVLALQFHLEVEHENIELLVDNCGNELIEARFVQSSGQMLEANQKYEDIRKKMFLILDNLESC